MRGTRCEGLAYVDRYALRWDLHEGLESDIDEAQDDLVRNVEPSIMFPDLAQR